MLFLPYNTRFERADIADRHVPFYDFRTVINVKQSQVWTPKQLGKVQDKID